jgi:hypothetical protein
MAYTGYISRCTQWSSNVGYFLVFIVTNILFLEEKKPLQMLKDRKMAYMYTG